MKYLLIMASVFMMGSANASYMATHCSNSTGSVKWETGHNSNSATLTYYEDEPKEKVVPFYELNTQLTDEAVIFEERKNTCQYASYTRIFSAKVAITASEENPTALDFLSGEKKIDTYVICTTHINSQRFCQ